MAEIDPTNLAIATLASIAVLATKSLVDQLRRKRSAAWPPASEQAGAKPPEFWQAEQRRAMTDVILATVIPILSQQTTILAELKNEQATTGNQMIRLITVIEERLPRRVDR